MAEKAKATGRKIGRGIRKNARYKSENRCVKNKIRRMERADKDYDRNFAKRKAEVILGNIPSTTHTNRNGRYPGWTYTDGYGYTRI